MAEQDPSLEADNPEGQRPEWLPENFKNPEDFAASYKESQRKITELAQEKKGLEESINLLSSQFEQFTAQQSQPDPDTVRSQWYEQFEADPLATMTQIAQLTAQQIVQQSQQSQAGIKPEDFAAYVAEQQVSSRYQDFDELRPQITELLSSDPLFQSDAIWADPQTATHALDRAYQTVKAQELLSGNQIAQQQLADSRAMKLGAQSAQGASGRQEAPAIDEWEAVKNAAAAERKYWQ